MRLSLRRALPGLPDGVAGLPKLAYEERELDDDDDEGVPPAMCLFLRAGMGIALLLEAGE
jgi:hypothetical protein